MYLLRIFYHFIYLITMSLTLLNKKFENLQEREKEIN